MTDLVDELQRMKDFDDVVAELCSERENIDLLVCVFTRENSNDVCILRTAAGIGDLVYALEKAKLHLIENADEIYDGDEGGVEV